LQPVIFLLLFLFGIAGSIFAIRWGGEDRDPPFIPKGGLFVISVLVGQWDGLQLLKWFFGRIIYGIYGDEARIPRREAAGENFEKLARTVLQAPRKAENPKRPRKATVRKKTGSDKG
jgi:hypothetical protein